MAQLDFQEIARLINYSRTTEIDPPPKIKERGWSVYGGRHKVHTSAYPFSVLYLHSPITQSGLLAASRHITEDGSTHVVFQASVRSKHSAFIDDRQLFKRAAGIWTINDYFVSFIQEEVQKYLDKLKAQQPKYYIDPKVETPSGFPRRIPNPVLSFLRGKGPESGISGGALGILLAEPGQGKTYMSRYLVSEIARTSKGLLPLFVDSSQWHTMLLEDQSSLAKTIAHSFRHFDATIGWLEGHEEEFLHATLKADLFRIVFDGFDEYILRNRGSVQAIDVLDALARLATANETRIVITSRTAFWNTNLQEAEVEKFVERTGSLLFTILPFDREHSKNYFKHRLQEFRRVERAIQIYSMLQQADRDFVGRGFVLSLIADLVEEDEPASQMVSGRGNALLWLMEALCQREVLRHQLPFTAQEQIDVMRTFAIEVAQGASPNSEFLEIAMHDIKQQLDDNSRRQAVEKFKIHPLLSRDEVNDVWSFRQEQIGVVLLADQIVKWTAEQIESFVNQAQLDAGQRQDLGTAVVDLVRMQTSADDDALLQLEQIVRAMSAGGDKRDGTLIRPGDGPRLASVLALIAVERFLPRGSSHQERTRLLVRLTGPSQITGLSFSGTIARYDFKDITFEYCRFERVTWANCKFDDSSAFRHCQFIGGAPPVHCEGFGSVQVDLGTCMLDAEADALFNSARVKEGHRQYSVDDLRTDLGSVINKFIIKGGIGLKTVDASNLRKGAISGSRYKDEIFEVLTNTVLDQHHISGTSDRGYNVREGAKEAVRFYATNNVFTGPLREAFERLKKRLLEN
jgi:hypothetical protein